MNQKELKNNLEQISKHMLICGISSVAVKAFEYYYKKLVGGDTGFISGSTIKAPNNVLDLSQLKGHKKLGESLLKQLVVIKLNGGLGTSMGLNKAKSLLPAKDGLSFLDIIIRQILELRRRYSCSVPLVFMNSFRTQEDTLSAISQYSDFDKGQDDVACSFIQNRIPKICQEDFKPIKWLKDPSFEWCPPGHGDIYTCLCESGILKMLISKGYKYAFVSNSDNLGAIADLEILGYLISKKIPFIMEVAERTEADKKGGHLAQLADGNLLLRELAQCPRDEIEDFQNINKYKHFNTNSLWLDLEALGVKLEENGGFLKLPLICNSKTVDPSDSSSPKVYQMEVAMGAAISSFKNAQAIKVPRSRFMPVKKTDDLLALWSDIFVLEENGTIKLNPKRTLKTPYISLDPAYFGKLSSFQERFSRGAPSLVDCSSLHVWGDVRFGKSVVIKGDVVIANKESEQMFIKDGTVVSS